MKTTHYHNPIKAIREFCAYCMGGKRSEIPGCTAPDCPLYFFRMGKNPYRKPPSEKRKAAAREMARKHFHPTTGSTKTTPNSAFEDPPLPGTPTTHPEGDTP